VYRILVGKPEGKRPLGRPRRRWVDNIKMDLREIGWSGMDWIALTLVTLSFRMSNLKIISFTVPSTAAPKCTLRT
jgi:hypothetical protein